MPSLNPRTQKINNLDDNLQDLLRKVRMGLRDDIRSKLDIAIESEEATDVIDMPGRQHLTVRLSSGNNNKEVAISLNASIGSISERMHLARVFGGLIDEAMISLAVKEMTTSAPH